MCSSAFNHFPGGVDFYIMGERNQLGGIKLMSWVEHPNIISSQLTSTNLLFLRLYQQNTFSESELTMARGIENVSGVSCHISCALQILYHVLKPLREVLKENKSCRQQGNIIAELTHFFRELREEDDDDHAEEEGVAIQSTTVVENGDTSTKRTRKPVNPSALYRVLEKETSLEQHNVGDASTAISKILQVLRNQQGGEDWSALLDQCGGKTYQVIRGIRFVEKGSSEGKNTIALVRTKRGKIKSMASPFLLKGNGIESVQSAIDSAFSPKVVNGYNWDKANPTSYEEKRIQLGEKGEKEIKDEYSLPDEIAQEWMTTKSMQPERSPRYWFLHLERFAYNEDVKRLSNSHVSVPLSVSIGDEDIVLHLKGGIAHVTEDSIEEEGHYVSIVYCDSCEQWFLLDDEIAKPLDKNQAVEFLEGKTDPENGKYYCATLLAYAFEDDENKEIANLVDKLKMTLVKDDISSMSKSDKHSLVGKRLRVRWSKGKFYSGIVESYDCANGKHRVKYDDGDIRDYILSKKTVEWI